MNMQEPVIEASRLSIGYLLKGGKRKVIHDDLKPCAYKRSELVNE